MIARVDSDRVEHPAVRHEDVTRVARELDDVWGRTVPTSQSSSMNRTVRPASPSSREARNHGCERRKPFFAFFESHSSTPARYRAKSLCEPASCGVPPPPGSTVSRSAHTFTAKRSPGRLPHLEVRVPDAVGQPPLVLLGIVTRTLPYCFGRCPAAGAEQVVEHPGDHRRADRGERRAALRRPQPGRWMPVPGRTVVTVDPVAMARELVPDHVVHPGRVLVAECTLEPGGSPSGRTPIAARR